ncbi:MAG: GGDEF domain-containing protein [Planctomycetota bacterium]
MNQTSGNQRIDPRRPEAVSSLVSADVDRWFAPSASSVRVCSSVQTNVLKDEISPGSASQQRGLLAETLTDGLQFFAPEKISIGRGSLLQIYPPSVHAGMIRLNRTRTLIGRDPSCDVALEDTAVSRNHAVIERDETEYLIADLNSRNGTLVDDHPLTGRRRLHGGELIRMGSTILKFMEAMDEEAQYHAVVHELMTRDPLTSAYNRSFLLSTLEKLISQCLTTHHDLSIIVIDIDFFKKVNDSHGHLVGDEVLRIFAERIRSAMRPSDSLCRLGGEEFVVVSERTSLPAATSIAERLRLLVASDPFSTNAGALQVTCSLGVASLSHTDTSATVDQLLSDGDQQLYRAKHSGRNMVYSKLVAETQG